MSRVGLYAEVFIVYEFITGRLVFYFCTSVDFINSDNVTK